MMLDRSATLTAGPNPSADAPGWLARARQFAPRVGGQLVDVIPLARQLVFGRQPDCHIVLPEQTICPRHAVLQYQDNGFYLADLRSRAGTLVNGELISRVCLVPGDRIEMGPYQFVLEARQLVCTRYPVALAVTAENLCLRAGPLPLLDSVSLVLQPGEFIGVIGPSGAGKTTLLKALSGLHPAQSGQVYINGEPLYSQYDRLRRLLGYVPQDDSLHRELTVRQVLRDAGRLRLGQASRPALNRLIEATLDALDLADRADVPIARLSGGQRKRASVGVELLSRPGVLFLDEPTSGLDSGAETRLMRTFKQLAGKGRTVVCTTHVLENADLFDKLAVLAPGGKLVFFGPPPAARSYFGIERFPEIFDRLESRPASDWQQQFRESGLGQRLQQDARPPAQKGDWAPRDKGPVPFLCGQLPVRDEPPSAWTQWTVLAGRTCRLLAADGRHLALMLAQPLAIAVLICLLYREPPPIFSLVAIAAFWFGCSSACQALVKERAVYRRERMVNLRLDAYLLGKFVPPAVLGAGQCALMLAVVWLWRGTGGGNPWTQFSILALDSWAAVATGLIISAAASNEEKATAAVPLVTLPQILLAGVIVTLPDMSLPAYVAAQVTVVKWANQGEEIALVEGQWVGPDLLAREGYGRVLRNLYPEYDLGGGGGRVWFLVEQGGSVIRRGWLLSVDYLVLAGFVVVQLAAAGVILRRQDPA
jgi:ABC-type multidrug transport system ATPase subunit